MIPIGRETNTISRLCKSARKSNVIPSISYKRSVKKDMENKINPALKFRIGLLKSKKNLQLFLPSLSSGIVPCNQMSKTKYTVINANAQLNL